MKRLVILLSVLLIAVTGPAFAQSTTGTIEVIVTDSSGAPLPGVTVTATAADTNTRRTEVTGADGTADSRFACSRPRKYVGRSEPGRVRQSAEHERSRSFGADRRPFA